MLNYVCEPYKELEDVVQTFEEQLELFFAKDFGLFCFVFAMFFDQVNDSMQIREHQLTCC